MSSENRPTFHTDQYRQIHCDGCQRTGKSIEYIGVPVPVRESTGIGMLREPFQVRVLGDVSLELDNVRPVVDIAIELGDRDERGGGSSGAHCDDGKASIRRLLGR